MTGPKQRVHSDWPRIKESNKCFLLLFYLTLILPGKLTENTFSFAATTWGIVRGERGINEPIVNWGLLGDRDGLSVRLRFSQDTGVNTPTLTISAMGSLMTSESQDTRLTSHPKDSTQHRAVSPITALGHWDIFLDQRKECLLLALQHHFQQHLVSHPGTDQDQPCLASEARQQWYAG